MLILGIILAILGLCLILVKFSSSKNKKSDLAKTLHRIGLVIAFVGGLILGNYINLDKETKKLPEKSRIEAVQRK